MHYTIGNIHVEEESMERGELVKYCIRPHLVFISNIALSGIFWMQKPLMGEWLHFALQVAYVAPVILEYIPYI